MGKVPKSETRSSTENSGDMLPLAFVMTIADTTWRMFVPSVGFTLLGVWADSQMGTKPWLMVAGIIVGAASAYLLVSRQIGRLKGGDK
ncbi:hypothetical protein B7Z00_02595 [Candidatus Saccharibacteria bacterium 32-50-10]|nr:MAG: hypothetical protein B7Z00_02595 [Candidatus Saccharibacteria bacterium 32-50-10]